MNELMQKIKERQLQVCIIDQEFRHPKRYQIMVNSGTSFMHVYPGKLFTLEEAENCCKENNCEVKAIGTIWECLDK